MACYEVRYWRGTGICTRLCKNDGIAAIQEEAKLQLYNVNSVDLISDYEEDEIDEEAEDFDSKDDWNSAYNADWRG